MKQTWVIRYLRIDGPHRRLPLSHVCTVEASEDGEARSKAVASYQQMAREHRLETLFLDAERVSQ